jgi:hypothetical protein
VQQELPTIPGHRPCRLLEWKPWSAPDNALLGHATVSFSGWVVHKIPVFAKKGGGLSVSGPSAPDIDAQGRVKLGDDGKRRYWKVLTFEGNDARERFERAVIGALAAARIDVEAGQ